MGNQTSSVEQSSSGAPPLITNVYPKLPKRTSGPRVDRFYKSEKHNKAVESGKFKTVPRSKPKLIPKTTTIGRRDGQSMTLKS